MTTVIAILLWSLATQRIIYLSEQRIGGSEVGAPEHSTQAGSRAGGANN